MKGCHFELGSSIAFSCTPVDKVPEILKSVCMKKPYDMTLRLEAI